MSEKEISDEMLLAFPFPETDFGIPYLQLLKMHQDRGWSTETIADLFHDELDEYDKDTVENIVESDLERAERIGRDVLERQKQLKIEKLREDIPDEHIR